MKRFFAVFGIILASLVMLAVVGRVVRLVGDGRATDEELRAERAADREDARAAFAAPAPPTPAEADDFERFFGSLGVALRNGDETGAADHFDADRLAGEMVRVGVFAKLKVLDTAQNRADLTREFRKGMGRALVQNELIRWDTSRVRAIRWAADRREAVVIALHNSRIGDEEGDLRVRWWLVGRPGGGWKAYDFEDLDMGARMTQLMTAVITPELIAAGPAAMHRAQAASTAVREALVACVRRDAAAAEAALTHARDVDLPEPLAAVRSMAEAGLALVRQDHAAALGHLDAADRLLSGMPAVRVMRATALNLAGRHEEALENARAYVAELGTDPNALTQAGYAHEMLGRTDEAAADYRRALDEFPDQLDALFGLRRVLSPEQKPELGERLAKARDPDRTFDELLNDAHDDDDAAGAAVLVAGLRKVRPDHPRVAEEEVRQLVRDEKFAEATALVRRRGAGSPRPPIVTAYLFAMLYAGRAAEALEGVPTAHAAAAFKLLADGLEDHHFNEKNDHRDELKEQRAALIAARRKQAPNDPWTWFYEASALDTSKEYDAAAKGFATAAAVLAKWDGELNEWERDNFRYRRVSTLYRAKKGLDALMYVGPAEKTFRDLGWHHVGDNDAAGLTALVTAHATAHPSDKALVYFRAQVQFMNEEYPAAAKGFGEYRRAATEKDNPHPIGALDQEVRSHVRAGDIPAARTAVGAPTPENWRNRALIAAAAGNAAELGRLLDERAGSPGGVASLFYDDDFTRRFAAPAFEELRRKYPDPRPARPTGPAG